METWIFIEFPITDFQIEIRSKMTSDGQIVRPFRVCLIDPSCAWSNCRNIKSWFQSNIFKTMRTVLTNYCDTLVLNHVIKVIWWSQDIGFQREKNFLYHCLWKGYDLSNWCHHKRGFRQEKSMNINRNQWNSMFLNGFDLAISITLILLNNLQCLQPSLFLDCLLFWLKRESVQPVLF